VDDLRTFLVAPDVVSSSGDGVILSETSISIGSNATLTLASPATLPGTAATPVKLNPRTRGVDEEVGKVKGPTPSIRIQKSQPSEGRVSISSHEVPPQAEERPPAKVHSATCEVPSPLAKPAELASAAGETSKKVGSLTPEEKLARTRARKRFNQMNHERRKKGLPSLPKPASWDMA
jgi:hypothetical protein